jgi:hypothetical protein
VPPDGHISGQNRSTNGSGASGVKFHSSRDHNPRFGRLGREAFRRRTGLEAHMHLTSPSTCYVNNQNRRRSTEPKAGRVDVVSADQKGSAVVYLPYCTAFSSAKPFRQTGSPAARGTVSGNLRMRTPSAESKTKPRGSNENETNGSGRDRRPRVHPTAPGRLASVGGTMPFGARVGRALRAGVFYLSLREPAAAPCVSPVPPSG